MKQKIEEELINLRQRVEEKEKRDRRLRTQSIVLIIVLAIIAQIGFAYGFIQRSAANKAQLQFEVRGREAVEYILRAEKAEQAAFTLSKQVQFEKERAQACEKARLEVKPQGKKNKK